MKYLIILCFFGLIVSSQHAEAQHDYYNSPPENYDQMSEEEKKKYRFNLMMNWSMIEEEERLELRKNWTHEQKEQFETFRNSLDNLLTLKELAELILHEKQKRCKRILINHLRAIEADDWEKEQESVNDYFQYSCDELFTNNTSEEL